MWFLEQFGGQSAKGSAIEALRSREVGELAENNQQTMIRNLKRLAWVVLYIFGPIDLLTSTLTKFGVGEFLQGNVKDQSVLIGIGIYLLTALVLEYMTNSIVLLNEAQQRILKVLRERLGYDEGSAQYSQRQFSETVLVNYCFFMSLTGAFALTWFTHGQNTLFYIQALRFMLYGTCAVGLGRIEDVVFSIYLFAPFQTLSMGPVSKTNTLIPFTFFARSTLNFAFQTSVSRMLILHIPYAYITGDYIHPILTALASVYVMDVINYRTVMCGFSDEKLALQENSHVGVVPQDNGYISEKGVTMVACLCSVYVLASAFSPTSYKSEPESAAPAYFIVSVAIAYASFAGRKKVEVLFKHSIAKKSENVAGAAGLSINLFFGMVLTLGAAVMYLPKGLALTICSGLVSTVLISLKRVRKSAQREFMWRLFIVLHFILILISFLLKTPFISDSFQFPVVLTAARCIVALERPFYVFSTILGLSCLCATTLACIYWSGVHTGFAATNVTSITFITAVLGSSLAVFREGKYHLIGVASQSSQFLDHAIKQKYAAVGCALEQLVGIPDLEKRAPQLYRIAKIALSECHAGRDMCHLSAFTHKLLTDPTIVKTSPITMIHNVLAEWQAHNVFDKVEYESRESDSDWEDASISFDPDLLQAVLCSMCPDSAARTLRIRLVADLEGAFKARTGKGFTGVDFACIDSPSEGISDRNFAEEKSEYRNNKKRINPEDYLDHDNKKDSSRKYLRGKVCDAFGATLNGHRVYVPLVTPGSSPRSPEARRLPSLSTLDAVFSDNSSSSLRKTETSSSSSLMPSGLSFAILDDVKVMRISLLKMCLQHAGGDAKKSFAHGASEEEALLFPTVLASRMMDVVIVDENLEYPDHWISGTSIAKQARERGFTKCLVLHSANGDLKDSIDSCFDGFIEKTSKRENFMRGLASAWNRYLERCADHAK